MATLQNGINANSVTPMAKIMGGTGVNVTPVVASASNFAAWDANANIPFNNYLAGYVSTVTAAGNTILTVASAFQQFFTGSTTQTVTMPVVSTLQLGISWLLVNLSSGNVTVNSSGGNLIVTLAPNSQANITCTSLTGTTAASWQSDYNLNNAGVASITGTANQVVASAPSGNVVLSLPQSIGTTSTPTFAGLNLTNPYIAGAGGLRSFQTFTTGTALTYTKPAGVTSILVEIVGGGGGGGGAAGAASSGAGAGGGGAGGYARLFIAAAAASYTYTVGGAGSAAVAGNNVGGQGGTTSFGPTLQATGGFGGSGSPAIGNTGASFTAGGTGGLGANGDLNVGGAPGMQGGSVLGNTLPGVGGSSHYGGGGRTQATAAQNYGSGGAGAVATTVSAAGGAATGGVIIVWEFA